MAKATKHFLVEHLGAAMAEEHRKALNLDLGGIGDKDLFGSGDKTWFASERSILGLHLAHLVTLGLVSTHDVVKLETTGWIKNDQLYLIREFFSSANEIKTPFLAIVAYQEETKNIMESFMGKMSHVFSAARAEYKDRVIGTLAAEDTVPSEAERASWVLEHVQGAVQGIQNEYKSKLTLAQDNMRVTMDISVAELATKVLVESQITPGFFKKYLGWVKFWN